jgi:D-alanyl-D-alanine carboxypeptidase
LRRDDLESTTKSFVATVVLQIVGEDRLNLHDTVQHWLRGLYLARPPITIEQLPTTRAASHQTSGFPAAPLQVPSGVTTTATAPE